MQTLQRHYVREFLRLYALICVGLGIVLALLDLVRELDRLMPYHPTAGALVAYALLQAPRYVLVFMPAGALICALFTVGHAARARETMAVTAAGGRVSRLFLPLVIAGVVLSVLAFALGELGVPAAAAAARDLEDAITGAAFRHSVQQNGKVWLRAEDGALVKIDFYLEGGNSFRGVSVFRTGEDRLEEIIRAAEGTYRPSAGSWVLRDVMRYETATGQVTHLEEMPYPALGSPDIVGKAALKPYEMGLFELRRYLGRLEGAGFRNTRLEVELQAKLATPVVGLIMVVLGISFAASRSMGGLAATAVGLVVSLLYWLGFTLALSLGYAGVLPPPAAAWAMPLIFGAAAIRLYRGIPE